MEDEFFFLQNDRVTGITPSLISNDHVRILGQQINDLPFAFISPLGSYDYDTGHC
jgi:hypothetical protein